MVTMICLLFGSFLILQTHGTDIIKGAGCDGDPNAEVGCDTCNTTCDNYDIEPKICSKRACRIDECKCIDGFVKNSEGLCIPYQKCPPSCGKNEQHSNCGGHCQKTCNNINPICTDICIPGCVCQPKYLRDIETNKCIKEDQCPKIQCGINEVPTRCLPGCPQDTCERAGKKKFVCYTFVPVPCKEGCVCQNNYFRNADGVCTSGADCLKCPRANEVFGCRRSCDDKNCSTLNVPCNIVNKRCTEKCYCKKGYARNKSCQCIPISKCPRRPVKCPVNEEYKCVKSCPPHLSRTQFAHFKCKWDLTSVNKCKEKPKCGENEVFACHITCPPKTCRSMVERIICPEDNPCKEQCDCKDNYLRSNEGKCIPSEQCFPSMSDYSPPAETDEISQQDNNYAVPPVDDDTDNDEDDEVDGYTDDNYE